MESKKIGRTDHVLITNQSTFHSPSVVQADIWTTMKSAITEKNAAAYKFVEQ